MRWSSIWWQTELKPISAKTNICDKHGNTLLHIAVQTGKLRLVELLLGYGIEVNILNEEGESAIDIARKFYNDDIADYLQNYAVNKSTKQQSEQECLTGFEYGV